MNRRRLAAGAAALALCAATGGCSDRPRQPEARAPTVRLSTRNRDDNAVAIAELVRRTCLAAIGDAGSLSSAIDDSGWTAEPVTAGVGNAPAVWRLDYGEIVHIAMAAPGGRFDDCVIALDPEIAPRPEKMRDALAPVLGPQVHLGPGTDLAPIMWQWRTGPDEERRLTIGARLAGRDGHGVRPGLSIHLASTRYDPRRPGEPGPPALLDDVPGAPAAALPDRNATGAAGN